MNSADIAKNTFLKAMKSMQEKNIKKDKINVSVNNKVYNINYGVVIAVSIVIIIAAIVLFVYIKNKKNNVV